jgi:hypothetical protein
MHPNQEKVFHCLCYGVSMAVSKKRIIYLERSFTLSKILYFCYKCGDKDFSIFDKRFACREKSQ